MRLADFILENLEPILQAWEDFAKSILPPSRIMSRVELRDHAEQMLRAIAVDLRTPQTTREAIEKSQGAAPNADDDTAAEIHAMTRLLAGFSIDQMVSEYRALRSSVLRLWLQQIKSGGAFEVSDMTRFNEAIDQALAESVASYSQAVDASRDLFLGIMGHDLRTPLGAIQLGTEVLLSTEELSSRHAMIASRIYTSVKRASKIVGDLLDFTRSQLSSGIPIQLAEANLGAICENMVDEVRTYHPEASIALETSGDLHGQFDVARIEQVFSNLIGNAVQHGSDQAPITVDLRATKGKAIFTLHNQGEPIAPDVLPYLFSPLSRLAQQAPSEYGPNAGLGLGLFIAHEIVVAHGGAITVDSKAGQGTTFTVSLPLIRD